MAESLQQVLQGLINGYAHDIRIDPHFRNFANGYNVLPVVGDMGGLLGISPNGSVFTLSHADGKVSEESDPRWCATALRAAKRMHPELIDLLPEEPAEPYQYIDREVLEQMYKISD